MEGISLLITSATIWSPTYPNLWMCLVRDSGLFIFLTQISIWCYSVAVLSQLYWACIQDKEFHTHRHTLLSSILTVFYSFSALQPAWPICAGSCPARHVTPILAVSWQLHCLLPHIWAAHSVASWFDLPLSQRTVSNPSLILS